MNKKVRQGRATSIHKASLLHILLKHILDLQSMLRDLILHAIVPHTIIKDKLHVNDELLDICVYIKRQFLLHCSEVHRILYYLEIVIDSESTWVHWFVEVVAAFCFPANWQHFLSYLHPWIFLFDLLYNRYIDCFRISQELFQFWEISQ